MSSFKNVLLIGASGNLGKVIQAELIAKKGNFSKFGVLTSSASTSTPDPKKDAYWESLEAQGVQVVKADFSDNFGLVEAFKGSILFYWSTSVSCLNYYLQDGMLSSAPLVYHWLRYNCL
jgi:uncharacterized protein YbjT (DUF2867 family)